VNPHSASASWSSYIGDAFSAMNCTANFFSGWICDRLLAKVIPLAPSTSFFSVCFPSPIPPLSPGLLASFSTLLPFPVQLPSPTVHSIDSLLHLTSLSRSGHSLYFHFLDSSPRRYSFPGSSSSFRDNDGFHWPLFRFLPYPLSYDGWRVLRTSKLRNLYVLLLLLFFISHSHVFCVIWLVCF
jgi:hypothetical protein